MGRRLAARIALPSVIALAAIAGGCDPLHPQVFFAAPWNDEDACLEKNAAVDVYDSETEPECTAPASCVVGPEDDGRLYVTTCQLPEGWTAIDANDARCLAAISAFRSGDDGRCT